MAGSAGRQERSKTGAVEGLAGGIEVGVVEHVEGFDADLGE